MKNVKLIVLCVCIVIGVCACMPQYKGNKDGQKVAVVGDSITEYATPKVEGVLRTSYYYSVMGIGGINLKDARSKLVQPAVSTTPEVLVVELGINSARDGWDSSDLVHLEGVLRDVRTVPCVVWVIPDALDTSYYDNQGSSAPTLHGRILQYKASVEKRLPSHPHIHMVYWGEQERMHPEWYTNDGLHNTPVGEQAYATYVEAKVRTLC